MRELINKLIANDLADLQGLKVTGSIPVRQELVNEAIQSFLQDALTPKAPKEAASETAAADTAATTVKKAASPSLPKELILGMVKHAAVKMHEGQMLIEFDIQR